jgi:predicted transposase/invertase (TIGR01784 family)
MNGAYLSPKIDIVFKKLFGVEENKDLLKDLINAIVSAEDQVEDLTILNPYNQQNFRNDKLSILDVKARANNGKMINIEIQVTDQGDYDKRALYYWSKLYSDQLMSGQGYSKLCKSIGIHILSFNSVLGSHKYHNIFDIREQETGIKYFQDLELHTIELNKFEQDLDDEDASKLVAKIQNSLDLWTAFLSRHNLLKDSNKLLARNQKLDYSKVDKAQQLLTHMAMDSEERELYEGRMKWYRMEQGIIEKIVEENKDEWLKEGKIEGVIEGKIEVARNMKKQAIALEIISTVTGLSISEIEKI